jgi:hypothetical protein
MTQTIGATTEPDPRTEGEQQAELLFELGQHYRRYTDLEMVDVYPTAPDLERGHPLPLSRITGPGRAHALTVWALSLTRPGAPAPTIHACAVGAHCLDADVFVTGTLASGRAVRIWAEVRGFSAAVGLPDPDDPLREAPVAIDQLFDYDPLPAGFSGDLATPDLAAAGQGSAATDVA